jgi:hypothetical protein
LVSCALLVRGCPKMAIENRAISSRFIFKSLVLLNSVCAEKEFQKSTEEL